MSPLPERWPDDPRVMRNDLRQHLEVRGGGLTVNDAQTASYVHALLTIAVEIRELRELLAALAREPKP